MDLSAAREMPLNLLLPTAAASLIGCSDPQNARSETTCTPNLGKGVADGGGYGGSSGSGGSTQRPKY